MVVEIVRNTSPIPSTALRSRIARGLLVAWLAVAVPLIAWRRICVAAPLPVFEAPWIDDFGLLGSIPEPGAAPELVDIDGDGDLDLFVWLPWEERLRFFRNVGTPSARAFEEESSSALGLTPTGMHGVFADADGDGDLDAWVGEVGGNTYLFENTGTPTSPSFTFPVSNPFGLDGIPSVAAPSLVDIDGDGDLDMFLGGGGLLFFANTGQPANPHFAFPDYHPFGLPGGISDFGILASFADIDGDGDLDAFERSFYFYAGSAIAVASNTGTRSSPGFGSPRYDPFGLTSSSFYGSPPSFGDIDGDGDLDAMAGDRSGSVMLFENTGSAVSPAFPPTNPFGLTASAVTLADLDGDGDLDAFGDGQLFENVGSAASPVFAAPSSLLDCCNPFALTDVDADGDLDAFSGLCFFENTGTASSPGFSSCSSGAFGLSGLADSYLADSFVDIDGDGDVDAFIGTAHNGLALFRNTGSAASPAFTGPAFDSFGISRAGSNEEPVFLDVDRDGDPDLFVAQSQGLIYWMQNSGTATSAAFAFHVPDPFGLVAPKLGKRTQISWADIDGDGDYDAFVGTNGYGLVRFFRNVQATPVFGDGFESGDLSSWSAFGSE